MKRPPMKLEALFDVRNGVSGSGLPVSEVPVPDSVPYLRPASTQQRTVAGWVPEKAIGTSNIWPEETLFVSTNGEGSHSYSYVSRFRFACNSDVAVLIPKREMTLNEKIYYARCITMNRYKFSYGRKPKGKRLKKIELPEKVPLWVQQTFVPDNSQLEQAAIQAATPVLEPTRWRSFKLGELFDIRKGQRLTRADMLPGIIPYVGASDAANGVTSYIGQPYIHKGGTISVSYNGSVAEAFYQPVNYWATDDVNVLYPKGFSLTASLALFICTIIRMEKFRFSYGRKWHLERMRDSIIKLPVTADGVPDRAFMEQYIRTLPYSSQLKYDVPE
ncbi:hypothetical protein DDQ45_14080 [Salmonella enterica]|nr:hypothetical protein [Salmonella enterica]EDR7523131.1 hypothetical protein [Salmonella enterica subsp. enterica serovar Oranienburg]